MTTTTNSAPASPADPITEVPLIPKTESPISPDPLTKLPAELQPDTVAIDPGSLVTPNSALPVEIPQDVLEHVSIHPPRFHRAMQLKLQGMKLQEISDELEVSISTCQNWIRKVGIEYTQLVEGSTSLNFIVSELFKIDMISNKAASDMANTVSPNQRAELMKVQLQCSRQRFSIFTKSGLVAQAPERLFLSVQSNAPKVTEVEVDTAPKTDQEKAAHRSRAVAKLISSMQNTRTMSDKVITE